jgi:polar amino acid transport system permease protein
MNGLLVSLPGRLRRPGCALSGLALTLQLTATTIVAGFVIGLAVAAAAAYGPRWARAVAHWYVEIIRNTPLLVQLFVVFFGLPSIGIKLDVIPVATIGLAINLGAYASEIIRAGIESIPKSQVEAAVALGLTGRQVFRHIILVPALKNVYPSLTSQFILLMLATSVASQIAAPELFYAGSIIQSRTYRDFEVYTVIAVAYLALALLLRVVFALCYRLLVRRR